MTNIVIFNGPPRSGKDYAACAVQKYLGHDACAHIKMSQPLKNLVSTITGVSLLDLEAEKEKPHAFGMHMSYRDAQIGLFESIARVMGRDWLGRAATSKIAKLDHENVVISDGGRSEEIVPLIDMFGGKNIMVVQLVRRGTSFQGDIRHYINDPRVHTEIVLNNSDNTFTNDVIDLVGQWITEKD